MSEDLTFFSVLPCRFERASVGSLLDASLAPGGVESDAGLTCVALSTSEDGGVGVGVGVGGLVGADCQEAYPVVCMSYCISGF